MYENEESAAPQKFCTGCGTPIKAGTRFCAVCGKQVAQNAPQQPVANIPPVQQSPNIYTPNGASAQQNPNVYPNGNISVRMQISQKEFIEQYADPSIKREIMICAIICYICVAINAVVWMFVNPLGLIDGLLLLGLALGMHLGKSQVCAILILVLGCIEVVFGLIVLGTLSGWLWLVAGACSVFSFHKANKQYRAFVGE